jgi:hypothetical protein
MSDRPLDILGWHRWFYWAKRVIVLAANGCRRLSLIGCTATAWKLDNATKLSDCQQLVQKCSLEICGLAFAAEASAAMFRVI